MDWANKTFNLIDEYKKRRILWNSRDACYKMHTMREETWSELGVVFGTSAVEVKRKMNSLLASYRRERMKMRSSKNGSVKKKKSSKWFAYHKFDFLDQMNKAIRVRNGQDVEDDEEEENQDQEDDQQQEQQLQQEEGMDELMEIRIEESSNDIQITEAKPKYNSSNNNNNHSRVTNQTAQKANSAGECVGAGGMRELLDALLGGGGGKRRDELDVYGEYIAHEIRKLNSGAQCKVKHLINNIIYEAQTSSQEEEENSAAVRVEFSANCVS